MSNKNIVRIRPAAMTLLHDGVRHLIRLGESDRDSVEEGKSLERQHEAIMDRVGALGPLLTESHATMEEVITAFAIKGMCLESSIASLKWKMQQGTEIDEYCPVCLQKFDTAPSEDMVG